MKFTLARQGRGACSPPRASGLTDLQLVLPQWLQKAACSKEFTPPAPSLGFNASTAAAPGGTWGLQHLQCLCMKKLCSPTWKKLHNAAPEDGKVRWAPPAWTPTTQPPGCKRREQPCVVKWQGRKSTGFTGALTACISGPTALPSCWCCYQHHRAACDNLPESPVSQFSSRLHTGVSQQGYGATGKVHEILQYKAQDSPLLPSPTCSLSLHLLLPRITIGTKENTF